VEGDDEQQKKGDDEQQEHVQPELEPE